MDLRQTERIGYAVITLAAFGVGMLVGARACAPTDEHPHADVREGESADVAPTPRDRLAATPPAPCPEPTVLYQCPPEPEPERVKEGGKKAEKRDKDRAMPEPEPEMDPQARRRLLAWVRDRSSDLKSCRDDSQQIYRVAIIMHFRTGRATPTRVDVNASKDDLPRAVSACIADRIGRWEPPRALIGDRSQVVFGLNI